MTTDPVPCPDCRQPLAEGPACTACGLQLAGPTASRLWQVDQRLALLEGEQTSLLDERTRLLALLRSGQAATTWAAATVAPPSPPTGAPPSHWSAPGASPVMGQPAPGQLVRRESSPKQVQNTLLGLGALLLALAGIVFAAVTYRHLGVAGRAAILLAFTGAAAAAPIALAKRSLTASAEAIGTVALALAVVDAWALRRAGFGAAADVRTYDAVATGILALAAGSYASVVPLRVSRLAMVAFAQLPVAFALARFDASLPVAAVTLTAVAVVDLLLYTDVRIPLDVRTTAAGFGALNLLAAFVTSLLAVGDHNRAAGLGLLAVAAVLVAASTRVTQVAARAVLTGIAVPLGAAAAWATVRPDLTTVQQPLVLVAVALMAVQVAGLLSRAHRAGPVVGSLAVVGVALLIDVEPVATALGGPFTWLSNPWTLTASGARRAVSAYVTWDGTVVTLVVLAAAAGCVAAAGLVLDNLKAALAPTGILLALSALVLPLGLATSYPVALVVLLAVAVALCVAGLLTTDLVSVTLLATACATAFLAAVWSTADQDATLTVLGSVAVLALGLSSRVPGFAGAAAIFAGAELSAVGASQDLSAEQIGGLLLTVPVVCVAISFVVRGPARIALESAAGVLATTAVILAVDDPGWLSWTIATTGLLCLAVAIRADRRLVGLAGGLLLSASSWVRLADADVHAPEPYVLPLALAALVFGYLRRRGGTGTSSFEAYGAGLSLALVPSLLKAVADPTPTRGLVLLVVCVAVVGVGARSRLQAPLVLGGAVLAVDGLNLLAPYASALPRWSLLAVAGTLLVVVGATYEQRLRDVNRLKERYSALG